MKVQFRGGAMRKMAGVLALLSAAMAGTQGIQAQESKATHKASEQAQAVAASRIRAAVGGAIRPTAPFSNETCTVNLLLCGQTISSALASTDCALANGAGFADGWFFPGYSRQAVGAAVSSSDFAPLIGIIDPAGEILAADEAPVGGVASVGAFLDLRGNYEMPISTSTTSTSKVGNYLLTLVCDSYPCQKDDATLCLGQGRYRVQVGWMNQFSNHFGFGRAIPSSDQAGFFSFDDPANLELLVKVLDFGDSVKVFYGELTNLHFMVTVTDMLTNDSKTYTNSAGDCGGIDQNAFPGEASHTGGDGKATQAATCRASSDTLCLLKGRFALKVSWRNQFDGSSGIGAPKPLSDLTGAFSFTDRANLELLFKIIDFGDRVAVFYGTLSNLEYTATVTDTRTGQVKTYVNPAGNYCGGLDNTAFPE